MDHSDWKIVQFLKNCKEAIENGNFAIVNRKKYKEFLESFDIFIEEPKNIILTLEPKDYVSGPEIDRNNESDKDIWIFKKKYVLNNGKFIFIYIKFKLIYNNNKNHVKCISFHKDEL